MFGSIFIGLSGLTSYSKGLQVISNNVSNMNTSGFKASDASFSDVYGQGSRGGLQYGSGYAGSGHGVSLNDITVNFSQGEMRQTDRDLDMAIDGNGFFVLQDGGQSYYTRTGSFAVNNEGYIVLANTDYRLAVLDGAGRPASLNIDASRTNPPQATTRMVFADNLSSSATSYTIPDLKVYNTEGKESVWTLAFTRAETATEWTLKVTDATGKEVGSKSLKFANDTADLTTQTLRFEDADNGLAVDFDFSDNVTSYSSGTVSTLRMKDGDGRAAGSISKLAVTSKGHFEITYTNEEKVDLGAIALADFRNPQKLQQRSGGMFVDDGFGQRQYLSAEDTRVGSILTRRLEASNVDLGSQFGELILIQRGFQASSQIISVSNDMIQQLFGIRGQG